MAVPDMIGSVAKDMTATLNFYRLLGLDIPEPAEGEAHIEFESNGYRLSWDDEAMVRQIFPDWTASGTGRMVLAFRCQSAAEVDSLYQQVLAAGHPSEIEPFDAPWGQRYAVVKDPDGNNIDLFAQL